MRLPRPIKFVGSAAFVRDGLPSFHGTVYHDKSRRRVMIAWIPLNVIVRWAISLRLRLKHPGAFSATAISSVLKKKRALEHKTAVLSRAFSAHEPVIRAARDLVYSKVEQWPDGVIRLKRELDKADEETRRMYRAESAGSPTRG